MIPRSVLFSESQKHSVTLSPSGQYLAWFETNCGHTDLCKALVGSVQSVERVCQIPSEGVEQLQWSKDERYLYFMQDNQGDENWRLTCVNWQTRHINTLTPPNTQAKFLASSALFPHEILLTLNQRDPHYHDVYRLNIESGTMTLIYQNTKFYDFIVDHQLKLQVGMAVNSMGQGEYFAFDDQQNPKMLCLKTITQHDFAMIHVYPSLKGTSPHSNAFYTVDSSEHNTCVVGVYSISEKKTTKVGHHPDADVMDILIDHTSGQVQAVAHFYQKKQWTVLDPRVEKDFQCIFHNLTGNVSIEMRSQSDEVWLVSHESDVLPKAYHLYLRARGTLRPIFSSFPAILDYRLNPMRAVTHTTRDGTKLTNYLTLPQSHDKRPPLVVWVHGGPNFRDHWGFNIIHQWLSSRGYGVLSINYRGSIGFGREFFEAGNGQWGEKIQNDILDAVQWVCDQGWVATDQVGIMGRSFGGYCVLRGLSETPERFVCGVDVVGPSNLESLFHNLPPYLKTARGFLMKMIGGDPDTPQGKAQLKARSPIHKAKDIQKPLLIVHGNNDVIVKKSESDQIVEALKENQIPITYLSFPDEGHQFKKVKNILAFYALLEAFAKRHLKGKAEPIQEAQIENSSMNILYEWPLNPEGSLKN